MADLSHKTVVHCSKPRHVWPRNGLQRMVRMIKGLSNQKRPALRETLRRLDRLAGDLNVLLVVIALGLATLDFTFFVTEKVVDSLPPITRMTYDAPQPSAALPPPSAKPAN